MEAKADIRFGDLPSSAHAERRPGAIGRLFRLAAAVVIALCALYLLSLPAHGKSLVMGGTGPALGVVKQLAIAFQAQHPESMIRVLPSIGTGGAVRGMAEGRLDLGLGGRPIKQKEKVHGLIEIPFARTPLVFAVHRSMPVNSITTEQIRAFLLGQKRRWPDGRRSRPVVRPVTDSETLLLQQQAPTLAPALDRAVRTPGTQIAMTAQENAELVARTPGAFGYTTLTLLISERPPLKALVYDGVEPSLENLANGSYPFAKTLYMITRPDPDPQVEQFIGFVQSAQGAEILRRFGNLPVK
jgi:phosphate transport system substrate-binding protein